MDLSFFHRLSSHMLPIPNPKAKITLLSLYLYARNPLYVKFMNKKYNFQLFTGYHAVGCYTLQCNSQCKLVSLIMHHNAYYIMVVKRLLRYFSYTVQISEHLYIQDHIMTCDMSTNLYSQVLSIFGKLYYIFCNVYPIFLQKLNLLLNFFVLMYFILIYVCLSYIYLICYIFKIGVSILLHVCVVCVCSLNSIQKCMHYKN